MLNHFKSVCSSTSKLPIDDEQSILLLTLLNWDLQKAVASCIDAGGVAEALQKVSSSSGVTTQPSQPPSGTKPKTFLQINLEDGNSFKHEFNRDDTLWNVYQCIASYSKEWANRSFRLTTQKSTFSESNLNLTLDEAGLGQGGVIRAVKS